MKDRTPSANVEYELDAAMARTGRSRRRQYAPTLYVLCVPPSKRTPEVFL